MTNNAQILPFRIEIPQTDLDDLQARLERVRWPTEQPGGWTYGPTQQLVRELVDHWLLKYNWRAHEARLNEYPQFTSTIDGTTVHFLHVRSPEPEAQPLLLIHGWPGSFAEYLDVIGPLTDPRRYGGDPALAFDLVIPSIPGFAFSGPTPDTGWHSGRIAGAFAELMKRLGYERYGVAGNDAGAIIAPEVGRVAPEQVIGVHVTQVFSFPSGDPAEFAGLEAEDYRRLGEMERFANEHSAFNKIQSTRPNALAYGLTDSPVGQLAWNLDLLRGFGEQAPEVQASLSFDWILTNVMIYWVTGTAGSSARIYYEDTHRGQEDRPPTTVPMGVAVFAGDFQSIRKFAERDHHNLVHWSEFDRGGHFAGTDAPDLLLDDIRQFFATERKNS
ncbi:epoxide hydrolase family protein [Catelliglobosispora koreensis]|uniref:epoxide hydrolase family protein n=1 Tax=Catelliglobosispora koreensis TaxID=129052 RepID=UPI0004754A3F|nr:epoxide hydrolase family protein [Catelliglobosispora koreensis]